MTTNKKIQELQAEIAKEKEKMSHCFHDWGELYYDPGQKIEGYGMKTVVQGSDIWPEYEGYHKVQYDRWARRCKKCGAIDYTEKTEPVVTSHKPVF